MATATLRPEIAEDLAGAAQPHCPHCATILRDILLAYRCETCQLDFLRTQL